VPLMLSDVALAGMKEHNPKSKIILRLRDPVVRAYSACWHCRRIGWETELDFEKTMKLCRNFLNKMSNRVCKYLVDCFRSYHLKRILNFSLKENNEIIGFGNLVPSSEAFFARLKSFIGLSQGADGLNFTNESEFQSPPLELRLKKYLFEYYKQDNRELKELANTSLLNWRSRYDEL
jgi:hypothetical protein